MVNRGAGPRMAMMREKKGMFFTMLALVILSLFLLTYNIYHEFSQEKSGQKRVKTLDNFRAAVEQDLGRQAYISGFRALFIIENRITSTGTYVTSMNEAVREIITNGTLYQEPQSVMFGATWNEIEQAVNEKAAKMNANVSLSDPIISVMQNDPWKVHFIFNTTLVIEDKSRSVRWTINKSVIADIRVNNFDDPIYIISTNGLLTNKIMKTTFVPFVQGTNVANLSAHATNSSYTNSSLAPSFLKRLEGDFTPDAQGIESIINLQELSAAGIPLADKSVVDYIYFSAQNPSSYRIQGMPSWFKLDSPHLSLYGVENLTI